MRQAVFSSTAQIIDLDADSRAWRRRSRPLPLEGDDPFWPEVSSSAPANPAVKPDNRMGRVLGEIALALGAAGALAFIVWACLPGGIAP